MTESVPEIMARAGFEHVSVKTKWSKVHEHTRDFLLRNKTFVLAELERAGHKVLPREMTDTMAEALDQTGGNSSMYQAMWEAAPSYIEASAALEKKR
jgi:hypothetical protein